MSTQNKPAIPAELWMLWDADGTWLHAAEEGQEDGRLVYLDETNARLMAERVADIEGLRVTPVCVHRTPPLGTVAADRDAVASALESVLRLAVPTPAGYVIRLTDLQMAAYRDTLDHARAAAAPAADDPALDE